MQIQSIEISKLIPDPSNARKHSAKNLDAIKGSLAKFGQQKPIVVGKDNVVIAGNGTLEAAKALGWDKINTVRTELTGPEAIAFAIADNRSGELAEWDLENLGASLKALGDMDFDLSAIGFDEKDLAKLVPEQIKAGLIDDDEVPEVTETRCKVGDLWQLGDHRLLCGDSTNVQHVERLMDGEKADMVFTDPPYGVSYEQGKFTGNVPDKKFKPIANDELRGDSLKDFICSAIGPIPTAEGCAIYCWSPPLLEGAAILSAIVDCEWHIQSQIVWDKKRLVLGRADYQWRHEICWYGYKGKNHYWCGDRNQTSIWEQKRDSNYDHPTQKPVELSERAVINSSAKDAAVYDCFLGSGSTLIACEKTNRRCFGMEIDPHYCDVIIARWEKFTGKTATLATE